MITLIFTPSTKIETEGDRVSTTQESFENIIDKISYLEKLNKEGDSLVVILDDLKTQIQQPIYLEYKEPEIFILENKIIDIYPTITSRKPSTSFASINYNPNLNKVYSLEFKKKELLKARYLVRNKEYHKALLIINKYSEEYIKYHHNDGLMLSKEIDKLLK